MKTSTFFAKLHFKELSFAAAFIFYFNKFIKLPSVIFYFLINSQKRKISLSEFMKNLDNKRISRSR